MHAIIRALSACLPLILWAACATASAAQDVDPFALLFGEEEANIDASENATTGHDDLNIVTLRLKDLTLAEGFLAYQTPGGLCLPFADVSAALEFPIEVSDDGIASGWFVESGQTLEADFVSESVKIAGRPVSLPEFPFSDTSEGWCATLDTLTEIFEIAFDYDERSLQVVATPERVLPIEARLERQAFREDILKRAPVRPDDFDRADNPYRWLSWPVADVGVDVRANSGGGVHVKFDIEAAGDILNTTGRIRTVGGSDGGLLDNLRVTVSRDLWDEDTFGGLAARKIDAGDITTPAMPLVSRSMNGAGVVITNRSSLRADMFDTTQIRGPLPTGWEAELYVGDELLDFVTDPDSNGDYVFEHVPLRSGYNRFTVKLYGPHGETDSRDVKYFVGAELEPENETSYFLGLVNSRAPLINTLGLVSSGDKSVSESEEVEADLDNFDLDEPAEDDPLADLFSEAVADPEQDVSRGNRQGYKLVGSASHGLTDKMTVRFDARWDLQKSLDGGSAASVSLASSVGGGYAVGRVITDGSGMPAIEAAYQRRIFERSNLSLRAVSYGDLENELTGQGGARRLHMAQIRGNSFIPLAGRSIPVQTQLNYSKSVDGDAFLDGSTRISGSVKGVRLTKSFNYSHTSGQNVSSSALGGSLLFARRKGKTRLVGNLGYSIEDTPKFTNFGVSAQRNLGKDSVGNLSLNHDMSQNRSTVAVGWSKSFEQMTLSTTGRFSDDKSWSVGARLGFSLAKEKNRILPRIAGGGDLSRRSAIRGHVFVDTNLNGIHDPGEAGLENAQLMINSNVRKQSTDETGVVIVDDVSTGSVQNVSVHLASIDDPFLMPAEPGRSYVPRPGQTIDIAIPLQPAGDIEGQLTVVKGEHSLVAGGVPIQVLDRKGRVVGETQTDFDGYFYLDKLPLRELVLRVPEHAIDETDIVSEDVDIRLTPDEPSYLGAELTVFVN